MEGKQVSEEVINHSKTQQEVDIKDFFEDQKLEQNTEKCDILRIQMEAENEANRRQMRTKRRVYLSICLLVLIFFIAIVVSIIGSVYVSNGMTKVSAIEEYEYFDEKPFDSLIQPNTSVDIDSILDSNDVVLESNVLTPLRLESVSTSEMPKESIESVSQSYLQSISSDTSLQRFLKRLRNGSNDLSLHDIPPAVEDFMQYLRRVFRLPHIRIEY